MRYILSLPLFNIPILTSTLEALSLVFSRNPVQRPSRCLPVPQAVKLVP